MAQLQVSLGPMNRSIIIGAFIISAAILVNGFLERRAHVGSTVSASVTPVPSPDQTIAVLPFENLSREPETLISPRASEAQLSLD